MYCGCALDMRLSHHTPWDIIMARPTCFGYFVIVFLVGACSLYGAEAQALSNKELVKKGDAVLYLAYAPETNMSIVSGTIPPCTAISQPHTHPDSAELNVAFKGMRQSCNVCSLHAFESTTTQHF
jgi:hypothetical protein